LKKNSKNHSNNSIRLKKESIKKGRHAGIGKRKGTKNARFSDKKMWITKQRVLRNYLKKSRLNSKINCHLHRELYLKCKGNEFKNKKALLEYIHKSKTENDRKSILYEKFEKKRKKKTFKKEKKIQGFNKKMVNLGTE
jgi:large subunit ribosomal protein L19e